MLKLGEKDIVDVRLGENQAVEIRKGEDLVWSSWYPWSERDNSYSRIVPNGAMKRAKLQSVGGKSVVWNQLTDLLEYVYTYSPPIGVSVYTTHKYLIRYDYINTDSSIPQLTIYTLIDGANTIVAYARNGSAIVSPVVNATSDGTAGINDGSLWIYCFGASGTITYKNIQLIDLTLWFGAGNEPTTVEQAYAMGIPREYIPYNPGEIISADVVRRTVRGRNLLNENFISGVSLGWGGGKENADSPRCCSDFSPVKGGTTVYVTVSEKTDLHEYDSDRQHIKPTYVDISKAIVLDQRTAFIRVSPYLEYGNAYKHDMQIEYGNKATAHAPYRPPVSVDIPEEIRALPGYGWSAGSVCNEVDYAGKLYIQRVSMLELAVDDMNNSEDYPGWKDSGVREIVGPNVNSVIRCISSVGYSGIDANTGGISRDIIFFDTTYFGLTQSEWKEKHAGEVIKFIIPRAEPIITDISHLIPDSLVNLSVEPGGSITYEQANGTMLPIPNTVEWHMRKPTSALSFADIKALAQRGAADKVLRIGDEIPSTYTYGETVYDAPWIVVDIGDVEFEDGHVGQAVTLEWKYTSIEYITMDAPHQEFATEPTAIDGLTYIARDNDNYSLLNLNPGDQIPYPQHQYIYHDAIRDTTLNIYRYGHNRVKDSAMRQWLNSSAGKGKWYTKPGIGYVEPSNVNSYVGFMAGLPSDVLNNVAKTKRTYYCNYVTDDSAIDTLYDKFFLASVTEIYGIGNANEGAVWPWYKKVTGLPAPSNAENAGRIKTALSARTTGQHSWTFSANRNLSSSASRRVTRGQLGSTNAAASYRTVPACRIG